MADIVNGFDRKLNNYLLENRGTQESEKLKREIINISGKISRKELEYLKQDIDILQQANRTDLDNLRQLQDLENSINGNQNNYNYGNTENINTTRLEFSREKPETIIVSISGEIINQRISGMHWQGLKSYPKIKKEQINIIGISENEDDYNRNINNRIDINSYTQKDIYILLKNGNREKISISYEKDTGIISIRDRDGENIGIAKLNEHYLRVNNDRMNLNISFH